MKLRNNQTITVIQNSTAEITTFKCIKHKEYMRNKAHYDKFRDPSNFSEIMNGVYLIIDSPNSLHFDTFICNELRADKSFKEYEIINPIEIQKGDIISYRKVNKPNHPVFKLSFKSYEDCKKCKHLKDGIYYVPIVKQHKHLQFNTLFDAMNYCYPGKIVKHTVNTYHIIDVQKSTKNKITNYLSNIKKDIVSMFGIVKRKLV